MQIGRLKQWSCDLPVPFLSTQLTLNRKKSDRCEQGNELSIVSQCNWFEKWPVGRGKIFPLQGSAQDCRCHEGHNTTWSDWQTGVCVPPTCEFWTKPTTLIRSTGPTPTKNNENKSSVTFYLASTRPGNRNQEKLEKNLAFGRERICAENENLEGSPRSDDEIAPKENKHVGGLSYLAGILQSFRITGTNLIVLQGDLIRSVERLAFRSVDDRNVHVLQS